MGFMDEYKENFKEKNGVNWEYSNEKLLTRYSTFKRTRESFSRDRKGDALEGGMIEMIE